MPAYTIRIQETVTYLIAVDEAENEEEARAEALQMLLQAESTDEYFSSAGDRRTEVVETAPSARYGKER